MVEVILAGMAVAASLMLCMAAMVLQWNRPSSSRGMMGLALSGVHMLLTLVLGAGVWMAAKPGKPVVFVLSGLVFYWISLIILVVAMIRWIRSGSPNSGVEPPPK